MPTIFEYIRQQRAKPVGDPFGRASCNRVFISLAIYLAYLFLLPHDRWVGEFAAKRILPFVFCALAGWGIAYSIRGFRRDASPVRAIAGFLMNLVCLAFHGFYLGIGVYELYDAYHRNGGHILIEYR